MTHALRLSVASLLCVLACSSPTPVVPDAGMTGMPDAGLPAVLTTGLSADAGSASEREPFIAVSPKGRVAVSFLAAVTGGYNVGYVISNDVGQTWSAPTLMPMPAGDNTQANASVAAGDDDTLYMAWAAEKHTVTSRSKLHVFVAVSKPGTSAFDAPIEISDPAVQASVYDQPRVVVAHSGAVNVGYLQSSPDGITTWIMNARSTDGVTWSRAIAAGPGTSGSFRNEARFCRPTGAGRLYMVFLDTDLAVYSGDLAVALRSSDDDGATWSDPLRVSTADDELTLDPGANLGCVTSGNDVWIDYGLTPDGSVDSSSGSATTEPTVTRLRLAHSSDSGKTIDRLADVLDPAAGPRAQYPVLTGEGGPTLDLSYVAGSFDGDPNAQLRRARSTDGSTFAPTRKVYGPVLLETSRSVPQWAGDYFGAATLGGDLLLVFTDNATTTPHVSFYRGPVALDADPMAPMLDVPDAGGDGGSAFGCYSGLPFVPVQWAAPTAFGQGACSPAQLSAYAACAGSGDCSAFRADDANAGCLACVETDVDAALHGPVVTAAAADGGLDVVDYNNGGCQAHYDGQGAAGSCGEQSNDSNDCVYFECAACSDLNQPSQGGPTYDCYFHAIDVGVCAQHRETTGCFNETLDGGASQCGDFATYLQAWCG